MRIDANRVITLGNGEKYLIIDKVLLDEDIYLYIAELNSNENDILDNYKIVKVTIVDNRYYIDEIVGEDGLKMVLPHFVESLSM